MDQKYFNMTDNLEHKHVSIYNFDSSEFLGHVDLSVVDGDGTDDEGGEATPEEFHESSCRRWLILTFSMFCVKVCYFYHNIWELWELA